MNNKILGWMTNHELNTISNICEYVPDNGIIVEVGSMFGRSTVAWASAKPNCKIYAIDTFDEYYHVKHDISKSICLEHDFPLSDNVYNIYEIFKQNTKSYLNIIPIRGYSPNSINYTNEPIDLFFLDASHSNPNDWENIEFFLPYIKTNGIIAGHDYLPDIYPDVVENVSRLEKILNKTSTVFNGTSIWYIKL